jgi:hypothetical protein
MTIAAATRGRFGLAFDWLGVERAWIRTQGGAAVAVGIVNPEVPLSGVDHFPAIAPEARLLPIRFSTAAGSPALDLAHALEYAVELGAHIINVGAEADLTQGAVRRAVQYAATRNVLVVCPAPPRDAAQSEDDPLPNVMTVLSLDEQCAPIDPRAAGADIAAPGFARLPHWQGAGDTVLTNVSLGAAYVSGCAALVKTLNPGWGYHELREHLMVSGTVHPELAGRCREDKLLNVAHAVLGPIELAGDERSMHWSSLNDALLSWTLRYRSAFCINAVALYRPHGDEHWRELAYARASSLHMVIPAAALRRSAGTLRLASREANFHSDEVALTIR